jgi:two-component system, chemotaxis family, chemotaxis protein CheY
MHNAQFLVVDDSKVVRTKVRTVLKNEIGAKNIFEASDGTEAMKILQLNKINMIISDWNMPSLSGEELLYSVRNNKEWCNIPFIMMTAYGERDFIMTAIQNGVSDYIIKPFTSAELEDKIRKLWNIAEMQKEERYNLLPVHNLTINCEDTVLKAQLININRTGALIRLKYDENLNLFKRYKLSLKVAMPNENDDLVINPIYGIAVRLEAEDCFVTSSKACLMALTFIPNMISRDVEDKFNLFLKYLSTLNPDTIKDELVP